MPIARARLQRDMTAVVEALLTDARFIPPAPVPGARDLPPIQQLIKSITRSIEGWPKAMFEERSWRPPLPGMLRPEGGLPMTVSPRGGGSSSGD